MARFQLKYHPCFVDDLEGAIAYYDEQSKVVGQKFKHAVKKQLKRIEVRPHTGSFRYDDIRFARIEKFPYAIHYAIDSTDGNIVLIHSLLCDYQDTDTNWRKRF